MLEIPITAKILPLLLAGWMAVAGWVPLTGYNPETQEKPEISVPYQTDKKYHVIVNQNGYEISFDINKVDEWVMFQWGGSEQVKRGHVARVSVIKNGKNPKFIGEWSRENDFFTDLHEKIYSQIDYPTSQYISDQVFKSGWNPDKTIREIEKAIKNQKGGGK